MRTLLSSQLSCKPKAPPTPSLWSPVGLEGPCEELKVGDVARGDLRVQPSPLLQPPALPLCSPGHFGRQFAVKRFGGPGGTGLEVHMEARGPAGFLLGSGPIWVPPPSTRAEAAPAGSLSPSAGPGADQRPAGRPRCPGRSLSAGEAETPTWQPHPFQIHEARGARLSGRNQPPSRSAPKRA